MKDIKLENLTQGLIYVLELEESTPVQKNMELSELRPYLKSAADISFIDKLLSYKQPILFNILSFESEADFLYLVSFPGKISNRTSTVTLKALEALKPYAKLFNEYCRIPYLAALLFNGAFYNHAMHDIGLMYSPAKEPDITATVKAAYESKDMFVVHGQPGTNKDKALALIIDGLLDGREQAAVINDCWIEDYKKRLRIINRPGYEAISYVEDFKLDLSSFVLTYKTVITELQKIYVNSLPHIRDALVNELLENIELLIKEMHSSGIKNNDPDTARLLRCIYALPRNSIVFEDNGRSVMEEALIRLNKSSGCGLSLVKDYAEKLKELIDNCDQSPEWFSELSVLRKRLLIELTPVKNENISDTAKNHVLELLTRIIVYLRNRLESAHNERNKILDDYVEGITPEILGKYLGRLDPRKPIVLGGAVIIDTDICTDEHAIMEAIVKSDKIYMLGSHMSGLFRIFMNAALCQEKKDGIHRTAVFNTCHTRHPKLVEFISQCFFETQGIPKLNTLESAAYDSPAFVWITPDPDNITLTGHIYDMSKRGFSIGILVSRDEYKSAAAGRLGGLGLEMKDIPIGTVFDFYDKAFDIVYLLLNDEAEYGGNLCAAMSKAAKALAVVGDHSMLKECAPLRSFYYICIGDDAYGRFYH